MIEILIIAILLFIFFETIIYLLFKSFKKDFQWLIGIEDINPKFSKLKLQNFIKKNYDHLIGWDRKASTTGFEISNRKTYFKINKSGFRGKNIYKKNKYSVFGDSFAFCRYVNDNETWQYHLAKKNKKNVLNFGVGNYGLDQAFLKYLKFSKKIKNQKIIFCVVPETIARVFSYWKHFREFKNIFAIKPIVKFKNKKFQLIKIPKLKTKNISENFLEFDDNFLKKTKKIDIFYNLKFKKHIFKFPYFLCFFKNLNFNSKLFYYLFLNKIFKQLVKNYDYKYYYYAYSNVLEKNIEDSHFYYEDIFFKYNFEKLLRFFDNYFSKKKIKYSILIVPQYYDLKLERSRQKYMKFFQNLKNPNIIDLTSDILKIKNWSKYFFKNKYGGHLNKSGNKLLCNIIYKKLI
tara:strand:- start:2670 stop:3878 length:1209 start_codon:yes stop_codon:yes gene_type:complete